MYEQEKIALYACLSLIKAEFPDIFSLPEHEVLIVSYCDQSLSVVRALSTFSFK